jgi:hypothetical protein
MKLDIINEPELRFGFNQSTAFAKDGLLWFGPLDDIQKPTSMRVGVVGSAKGLSLYQKWIKKINLPIAAGKEADHHVPFPGFEAIFCAKWPDKPLCSLMIPEQKILQTIRIKDRHQAIYNTVTLFENEIRRYINEEDSAVDLWFVVIPEEVYKYGRPQSSVPGAIAEDTPLKMNAKLARDLKSNPSLFDEDNEVAELYRYELHFHNQLKARLLDTKAVVQVVRETTLAPEEFSEVYISPFSQAEFIELHNNNKFDETVKDIILPICEILVNNKKIRSENAVYRQPNKLLGFNRHLVRKRRRRL